MALDSSVIDAATAPGALWSPWTVAAQLGVRVVRVPMTGGYIGVTLWSPTVIYLNSAMRSRQEDFVLTRQLLCLFRDGWPEDMLTAEAAFLVSPAA